MSNAQDRYDAQVRAELGIFSDWTDIHELPGIFHYWSNRYVRPKLESFGFSSPAGPALAFSYASRARTSCGEG